MPVTPVALYPSSVWDTLVGDRDDVHDYIEPTPDTFLRSAVEIKAIEKDLIPTASDLNIWVSPTGIAANATGSIVNPYATIVAALAAITATKKTVVLMPGTYALAGVTVIPVAQTGIKIIGIAGSNNTIINAITGDQAFSLTPGAQGAAYEISLEGFTLNQFAAKKGLYVDDTGIDDSVTINTKDVIFVMDTTGSSIDTLHAVNQAVILNSVESTFGPLTFDCINAGDEFNFNRCDLSGGIISDAGAVAAAFVFKHSTLKASGMSGGHSSQTIISLGCFASDNTAVETGEFTGSHTETLIA
jgi:hypothetical protein